jgi:hypothetical protein
VDTPTRNLVRERARNRCEYCLLPQEHSELTHHIEHIIAKQHGGSDEPDNLALACHRCNLRKGPNVSGVDTETGQVVPLFHPRRDEWLSHFQLKGPYIEGITPSGRATARLLTLNDARRLEIRAELMTRGEW